jgi:predicted dinucleotide-binding enzyme
MKIGVLGTGVVGQTMAGKLLSLGHDVMMGARAADNEKVLAFAQRSGGKAGSFGDAIRHAELVINGTRGDGSVDAIRQGAAWLDGKLLIDIANPLDFSRGFPPGLSVSDTDSLGERIQREFPGARVVKTLNTVTASIMVEPHRLPGLHTVFLSGNDIVAKGQVADLLRSFGWQSIIDLGDITTARAVEHYVALWVRLLGAMGTAEFNIEVKAAGSREQAIGNRQ